MKDSKNLKILILGENGFVGKKLKYYLEEQKYTNVYGTNTKNWESEESPFDALRYHLQFKPDIIFNCIAVKKGGLHFNNEIPADIFDLNVRTYLTIYQNINHLSPSSKIVNLLPNCTYPKNIDIQVEEKWLDGEVDSSVVSYANAKRTLYYISQVYQKQYGIESINLIFPGMFGEGDHLDPKVTHALDGMIIRMIKAMNNNEKTFEIWGNGNPIREWIYIEDTVRILENILHTKHEFLSSPLNIAQRTGYSITQTAIFIREILNYDVKFVFNTQYQNGAHCKILDNQKFKQVFPSFKFTDFKTALKNTVEYYKCLSIG